MLCFILIRVEMHLMARFHFRPDPLVTIRGEEGKEGRPAESKGGVEEGREINDGAEGRCDDV